MKKRAKFFRVVLILVGALMAIYYGTWTYFQGHHHSKEFIMVHEMLETARTITEHSDRAMDFMSSEEWPRDRFHPAFHEWALKNKARFQAQNVELRKAADMLESAIAIAERKSDIVLMDRCAVLADTILEEAFFGPFGEIKEQIKQNRLSESFEPR